MTTKTIFKPTLIFAVLVLIVPGFGLGQEETSRQISPGTRADLDGFFNNLIREQKYVGLGASLIKNGTIVWDGYYGYANLEEKIALDRDNIFQLASLSKTVTAFALMTLLEQGLFDPDDDINKYMTIKVRNPNFPETPITFRMLLNHTASFADVTPTGLKVPQNVSRPPTAIGDAKISLAEYIQEILIPGGKYYSTEYFSLNAPGTKYEYSNIGYALIGFLVEKIARQDFSAYCKNHIFAPLEMTHTSWHLRDLDTSQVVFGYSRSPGDSVVSYHKVRHFGEPGYPSGMLRTTMPEFARFIGVIINNGRYGNIQVLKPETIALMLQPQNITNIPSRSFKIIDRSLAWLITEVEGTELYTMNGFSGSIFTNAYFSKTDGTGILYYFTGLSMKSMAAMAEITKKLYHTLQVMD